MSKCKNCNCICHCSLEEHSDTYGICSCTACTCSSETIVDNTKSSAVLEKEIELLKLQIEEIKVSTSNPLSN